MKGEANQSVNYHIRIMGHLEKKWEDWFGKVRFTYETNGETTITCTGFDQAELFGLLKKIRNLGLPLLSVQRVSSDLENLEDDRDNSDHYD